MAYPSGPIVQKVDYLFTGWLFTEQIVLSMIWISGARICCVQFLILFLMPDIDRYIIGIEHKKRLRYIILLVCPLW